MREVGTSVFEQYGLVDARAGVQSLAQRAYRGDVAVGRPIVIAHVHERDCEGDEALLAQTGDEALRVAPEITDSARAAFTRLVDVLETQITEAVLRQWWARVGQVEGVSSVASSQESSGRSRAELTGKRGKCPGI